MEKRILAVLNFMLCLAVAFVTGKVASPQVQVYTLKPGQYGKANTLICHVSKFFPPIITVELLKDGVKMTGANQTDLAFDDSWYYHLTKSVSFIPKDGDKFVCAVTHEGKSMKHSWEPDE